MSGVDAEQPAKNAAEPEFTVLKEEMIFKRYVRVMDRQVRYPNGKDISFDVFFTPSNHFVTVLPFFTATKEFAIIREYAQGPNAMVPCVATGGFDLNKHKSVEEAARHELSEECELCGGQWERLLPEGHPGAMEAKWSATRFTPFLVLDPEADVQPRAPDTEEYIVRERVPAADLEELAYSGALALPSAATALMGLRRLRRAGLL